MFIVCISASNIKHAKNCSTSTKTCSLIKDMINEYGNDAKSAEVTLISLVDYELRPCIGCGRCFNQENCSLDDDFNKIYNTLIKADGLFIISAHYAPIPSKLSILLEKIEQLTFLKRFNDETYRSPLYKKPAGIIGHGGGTKEIIKYYEEPVLNSIWNALSYPVEMDILKIGQPQANGVILPVKSVTKVDNCIFPVQEYDWQDIKLRLTPLVEKMLLKLSNKTKIR